MAKAKYNDTFPLRAEDYARRGLIDKQIAKSLGISIASYYKYQKGNKEFLDAIKRGKAPVDVEVENALLKRARGFEYTETVTEFKTKPTSKTGSKKEKKEALVPVSVKKTQKVVVPDTGACAFWLKNRRPDIWKDKHDLELAGIGTIILKSSLPRPKKKNNNAKRKNH